MLRQLSLVLAITTLLWCAPPVDAAIVTFDDLTGTDLLPDGYGGINWGGQWTYYDEPQSPYTPHSGLVRSYNQGQISPASFTFSSDVVFNGAWFAGIPAFAEISFELYDDGNLVHTSSSTFVSENPIFLSSGFSGSIDRVDVLSTEGDFYVMDDVTYNSSSAAVPEPTTLTMFSIGGLGLAIAALRRRLSKVA